VVAGVGSGNSAAHDRADGGQRADGGTQAVGNASASGSVPVFTIEYDDLAAVSLIDDLDAEVS